MPASLSTPQRARAVAVAAELAAQRRLPAPLEGAPAALLVALRDHASAELIVTCSLADVVQILFPTPPLTDEQLHTSVVALHTVLWRPFFYRMCTRLDDGRLEEAHCYAWAFDTWSVLRSGPVDVARELVHGRFTLRLLDWVGNLPPLHVTDVDESPASRPVVGWEEQ